MEFFDRDTIVGMILAAMLGAIPVALIATAAILVVFRHRVQRSMALAVRSSPRAPEPRPTRVEPPRDLAIVTRSAGDRRAAGPELRASERAWRRTALVAGGAGMVHAALAAFVFWALTSIGYSPKSVPRFVAALLLVFSTPAVLAAVAVTLGRQRHLVAAAIGWVAVLAYPGHWMAGGHRDLVRVWLELAAVPTLVVVLLAARRLRAVGPLVVTATWLLLGALLGGFQYSGARMVDELGVHFADPALARRPFLDATASFFRELSSQPPATREARVRAIVARPSTVLAMEHPERATLRYIVFVHLRGLAPLAVAALLVAALVRWYARRYRARRASDQALVLETIALLFTVAYGVLFVGVSLWGSAFVLSFLGYRAALSWGLRVAARPPAAPKVLLLLRVFRPGSGALELLDAIGARWRYLGPIRLIAATDVAQASLEPHEFYQFLSGRLSRKFIRDPREIDARLAVFGAGPDPDGRFRVEDFFCHEDTWKDVVSRLMHGSDVILMDLRAFSAARRGCRIEIELLVHTVPLERVVLLADGTTDLALLQREVRAAWARLPADSPNALARAPALTVLLAGASTRAAVRGVLAELTDRVAAPPRIAANVVRGPS